MRNCLLLSVLAINVCAAQHFTKQSTLPKVDKNGFYRIMVDPNLAAYLNERFTNIRIYDKDGTEVRYLFRTEELPPATMVFNKYEIVEREHKNGAYSRLVFHNPSREPITNISLLIKNAAVTKTASLFGSDDKINWHAVKEEFILSNINNARATSEVKIVDFPLSNYEFYAIKISDKKSAPLNILQAGYYSKISGGNQQYQDVPAPSITQSDSIKEKKSFVRFNFDTLRLVDKIEWTISEPAFFFRNANLYQERTRKNKKGKTEKYLEYLTSGPLSTGGPREATLPALKIKDLVFVIQNEDNPPLRITHLHAYQLNRYLTAWLEKENEYTIKLGGEVEGENYYVPQYDLIYFEDSIPDNATVLHAGPIISISTNRENKAPSFFTSKLFIWSALIIVISLLGFMSVKLVRETSAVKRN
jgi:hypothetical protein